MGQGARLHHVGIQTMPASAILPPTVTTAARLHPPPRTALKGARRAEVPPFPPPPPLLHSSSFCSPRRHEDLTGASLLWPFPGPDHPSTRITESQSPSTTTPTPTSNVSPAAHRHAHTSRAKPHHSRQIAPMSPLLSAAPNLVRNPTTSLPRPSPLHLVVGNHRDSTGPSWTGVMGASSPIFGPGPKGQLGQENPSWAGLKTLVGRAQGNSTISFFPSD
jgi:hypothetical protein